MTTAGDPKQKDDGSGGKYGPRLTYAEREAYANSTIPRSGRRARRPTRCASVHPAGLDTATDHRRYQ